MIRLSNGGRIDFWSLEDAIAGRGRRSRRVVIDEAAFTKDGDNRSEDSMVALWEKGIKPPLFDYGGEALVCSNSAARNPDNFFYNICTDPQYGFREFHVTTLDNRSFRSAPETRAIRTGTRAAPGFAKIYARQLCGRKLATLLPSLALAVSLQFGANLWKSPGQFLDRQSDPT